MRVAAGEEAPLRCRHDSALAPQFHRGLVLKHNVNQRYATNAVSAALFRSPPTSAATSPSLLLGSGDVPMCVQAERWAGGQGHQHSSLHLRTGWHARWPRRMQGSRIRLCQAWASAVAICDLQIAEKPRELHLAKAGKVTQGATWVQGGGAQAGHPNAGVCGAQRHGLRLHHRCARRRSRLPLHTCRCQWAGYGMVAVPGPYLYPRCPRRGGGEGGGGC